jgi:quercetin dioxygenase-like cupin family protein
MKHDRLEKMVRGWFVGNFSPAAYSTDSFEVAVKNYRAGECEDDHFHKVATEITVVISGVIRMKGFTWREGDIITLNPGENTAFEALTDSILVVVKTPSVVDDKYLT